MLSKMVFHYVLCNLPAPLVIILFCWWNLFTQLWLAPQCLHLTSKLRNSWYIECITHPLHSTRERKVLIVCILDSEWSAWYFCSQRLRKTSAHAQQHLQRMHACVCIVLGHAQVWQKTSAKMSNTIFKYLIGYVCTIQMSRHAYEYPGNWIKTTLLMWCSTRLAKLLAWWANLGCWGALYGTILRLLAKSRSAASHLPLLL